MHTSQNSEGSFQTDEFERVQVFFRYRHKVWNEFILIHFGWVRTAFRCLGDRLALQLWATDCQQTEGLAVNF